MERMGRLLAATANEAAANMLLAIQSHLTRPDRLGSAHRTEPVVLVVPGADLPLLTAIQVITATTPASRGARGSGTAASC